ncbi:MAG: hypothetical protein KBB78_04065, partial [Candidatus Pacebacteria bacterium]|nr:hypothetical protein [Candidatus Paceibacterota bacterium]
NAFSVLQATAATLGLAILLWSVGLPSLRFAEAANVTSYSDTLSDSAPSVASDHTIEFTTPTGVTAGQTIVITFPDSASDFNLAGIGAEDIDLASTTGDYSLQNGAASNQIWGVSTSTFSITLTSGTAVLSPNATVTIEIGSNALFGGGTQTQIVNPAIGSYPINLSVGNGADTGETRVAILSTVDVTASVDTLFTFSVGGLPGGSSVSGTTTTGATQANEIPFGQLEADVASTAAQSLTVITNARNGFVVTVETDQQLSSTNGADIDGFRNGNYDTVDVPWEGPTPSLADEDTWGHWGLTSDDTDYFASGSYVSASTTPVEIFAHDGPIDGTILGEGTVNVGYTVEISGLQEAAEDYQAVLTYIATPVF